MPINAKLSAKPLQTINAHVLDQFYRWLNASTQIPANNISKLLQRKIA